MKKLLPFFIFTLYVFTTQAQTLMIDGTTYSVDTLENHQVGPGTQYVALRLQAANRLDVYFLKTDLKNAHIQIRTALGRDSIYTGERPSDVAKRKSTEGAFYFAGTNGDFYNTTGYVGYPIGGSMVDSEIAKTPIDWNAFIMDDEKIPDIGKISYNGMVYFGNNTSNIHTVNHLRNENQLVLYNRHNGKYTRTNPHGTEVLVELLPDNTWSTNRTLKAKVLKIEKGVGNMPIPKGQAVLSGHGTSADFLNQLSVNNEIEIRLELSVNGNNQSNFTLMSGGDSYATMLKNGLIEQGNVWNELHPRTGIGYSQNRDTLIFAVIDGRGLSAGATTKQFAYLMKSAGAYTAFNMDGGGSSSMYISEYNGPVNDTSDPGGERAVSNSIFVVSTAPSDNEVAKIVPHDKTYSLPYLGEYIPKFYGYNQYGILLNSDLQDVVLTCPPTLGKIEGNKFIATGNTPGQITATYNGNVVTQINIDFLPVSGIKIRLDSVLMDNRRDYPIEVFATTTAGDALISPAAFTWDVENPEYASVENGTIKALNNGQTKITGKINDITDDILVKVENPGAPLMIGDSLLVTDWTLSNSSFLKSIQLNTDNRPLSWETGAVVNFIYTAGRAPFIKMINKRTFYGLPDTVKLVMNLGDVAISRAIVSLKPNNATTTTSREFNSFVQNKDFSLDIPVDKLFDVNDRTVYPIGFDNVNFYLDASNMIANKAYSLAVKEITLVYKDYILSYLPSENANLFQVYPNPIEKGKSLKISLIDNSSQLNMKIQLFDLQGKLLKNEVIGNTLNKVEISMQGLAAGTYLLKLQSGERSQSVKVIVK